MILMWGENLKRVISIMLTIAIIMLSVADGMISYALNLSTETSLEAFANDLAGLVREYASSCSDNTSDYDDYKFDFPLYYNPSVNEYFSEKPKEDVPNIDVDKLLEGYDVNASDFESNRLIVKSTSKINYCGAIDYVSGYKDLYILQYETIADTIMAYKYYLTCSNIDYVEPDYIATVQATESEVDLDTSASEVYYEIVDKVESWHTEENGFDSLKEELTQIKLSEILVAVIDSGVDTDHEIFENRLIEGNVNLSSSGEENSCEDDYGHGTHVSGIIVDNSLSNVKIKPYKVLNNRGKGTISLIAIAVDMAVADGADVINLSLTSQGESQTMTDAVNTAVENNINVVVAAGNKSTDLSSTYYSPACIESAITVSATTKDYKLSSYSNYNGTIDIAAPGDDIKSAYLNNTYTLLDGTSMASAQVSAGVAIVKSAFPDLSSQEVEDKLEEYSIKMSENAGENHFGAGLLYLKYILSTMPKTAEPVFNIEDCDFSNSFNLTITCPEADAKILYVIYQGSGVENLEDIKDIGFFNGTEYKEPILISLDSKISAVAYSKGKMFSSIVTHEYNRSDKTEEDNFDIDDDGLITGYFGTNKDVVIPETIRGTIVKGIGKSAFKEEDIHSVTLPQTATIIGEKAFYGCSNLVSVIGGGLKTLDDSAFELSTIEEFPFEQIEYFGESAFSGCNNLQNVVLSSALTIGKKAFENAKSIVSLNTASIISIEERAFRGTDIQTVNLPNITAISRSAFENCSNLTSVNTENVTEIKNSAFEGCISLTDVNMPSLETIGNSAFKNTGLECFKSESVVKVDNYAFSSNAQLKSVFLPNVTDVGSYAFQASSQLKFLHLPSLIEVGMCVFSECSSLKSLWLPSVNKVHGWGFKNSNIEYLQLDSAEKILSLPDTLTDLVVSSKLTSITVKPPVNDLKIYGYSGTYAETFAVENDKEFVEVPAIVAKLPETFDVNEKYIYAYSFGFNCTYQWYENDAVSNVGGTLIEGATNFWYEPNKEDEAVAYYCVITSDDGVNYRSIASAPITNSPYLRSADLSEYYSVLEETKSIDRDLYTDESLSAIDKLTAIDVSDYSLADQERLNSLIQSIKDAVSSLAYDYHLGDINNDGKVSLIDVRLALKTISGSETLDQLQALAADLNEDEKISLIDVRMILKIISGELIIEEY